MCCVVSRASKTSLAVAVRARGFAGGPDSLGHHVTPQVRSPPGSGVHARPPDQSDMAGGPPEPSYALGEAVAWG